MSGRRGQRWGMPKDRREPLGARISLLTILTSIFLWIGLRNVDVLIISLTSTLLSLLGMITGYRTGKRIRRYQGRLTGEAMATIGYWGNLLIFTGSIFLFALKFAMGFLRGNIL